VPVVTALVVAVWGSLIVGGAALAQTQTSPPPSPGAAPGADVTRAEDQVVLSGTVSVPRGRAVGEVVVFHGRAVVSGVVAGDVVVFDGPIAVSGQVSGSVVALNGPIRLGSTASVGGDVLGSQQVRLDPGAFVRGGVRDDVTITARGALAVLGALLGALAIAFSALLVLLMLLAIAPRGLDRVAAAGITAPFASAGWGVVVALGLPVLAVAAAASILGLPLGLSLLLAIGLVALVGYAFAAFVVGRLIVREPRARLGALLAGWGIAAALSLVPLLNLVVWVLGSVFGVGAVIVAAWRTRSWTPSRGRHRVGYAPAPHRPAHAHAAEPAVEPATAAVSGAEAGRDDDPPAGGSSDRAADDA
jgi:hypothetical protein